MQERLGLAAEHGYFLRYQASQEWENQSGGHADLGWKDMVIPILEVCLSFRSVLQFWPPQHFIIQAFCAANTGAWVHDAHSSNLTGILSRCSSNSDAALDQNASSSRVYMDPARLEQSTTLHCAATSFNARPDTCCGSNAAVACQFLLWLLSLSSVMAWQAAPVGSHGPEPDLLPVRS